MKSLALISLLLCSVAPESGAVRPGDKLALTVAEGTSLTKTFASELVLELQTIEMTITVEGEEHELDSPELEMRIEESESLTFTDTYRTVDGGRATELRRRFDDLSETSASSATDPDGDEHEDSEEGVSELEGHTVDLTWDEDGEAWAARFAPDDDGGDEDLLGELEHHADLIAFLPRGDVAVGDEWTVPASAFLHLSNPCGELHLDTPSDKAEADDDTAYEDQFEEHLEGEFAARLERIEDGVARIALSGSFSTSVELPSEEVESEDSGPLTLGQGMVFEFDLEGHLEWSIEAGHALALTVEGDVRFDSTQTQTGVDDGVEVVLTQIQRFAGTLALTASFE